MDIATVVGVALAMALILGSIVIGGGSFVAFIDVPSLMVVVGGAIAAGMISFPLKNFLSVFGVTMKVFFNKAESIPRLIEEIVSLAETARRDGLLALESRLGDIENSFVVLGIQMAVDGTRPEVMEDILRTELDAVATRHRDGKALHDCMGRFAPAFGMIGTLMGLVIMLGDMSDPSKIGAGMAVALLTTCTAQSLPTSCFCRSLRSWASTTSKNCWRWRLWFVASWLSNRAKTHALSNRN